MRILIFMLLLALGCSSEPITSNIVQSVAEESLSLWLEGDDLPPACDAPVTLWPARVGPDAVSDLPQGLPTYVAPGAGQNGHAGVRLSRDDFPRMKFGAPISLATNHSFLFVSEPSGASATGSERRYFFTSTETPDRQGTRMAVGFNANSGLDPTFDKSGFFNDNEAAELPGANPGWHRFFAGGTAVSNVPGVQVDLYVLGESSYWCRNGVIVGRELTGVYASAKRTMAYQTYLFASNQTTSHGVLVNTGTYFDGKIYRIKMWDIALSEADAIAESTAAMSTYGVSP